MIEKIIVKGTDYTPPNFTPPYTTPTECTRCCATDPRVFKYQITCGGDQG